MLPQVAPVRKKRVSLSEDEPFDASVLPPGDTTLQHNEHLFDLNCKICTGLSWGDGTVGGVIELVYFAQLSIVLFLQNQKRYVQNHEAHYILHKIHPLTKSLNVDRPLFIASTKNNVWIVCQSFFPANSIFRVLFWGMYSGKIREEDLEHPVEPVKKSSSIILSSEAQKTNSQSFKTDAPTSHLFAPEAQER